MDIIQHHITDALNRLRAYFTHSKRTNEDLKRLAAQLARHNLSPSEIDKAVLEAEDTCEHFPSGAKLLKMARPMGGAGAEQDLGFGCRYDSAFERALVREMDNANTAGERLDIQERHGAIVEARWRARNHSVKSSRFADLDAVLDRYGLDWHGRKRGLQPL